MKQIIVFLFAIVMATSGVKAQSRIQTFGRYSLDKGTLAPDVNVFIQDKLTSKVNLTCFALVEHTWSEALIGFNYSPKPWLNVGLSAGMEHKDKNYYRCAGSLWTGKGKMSLLVLGELGEGNNNYWYKTVVGYKNSDTSTFAFNVIAWRFHGIGPSVTYSPKKSKFSFWILPAYDPEFKVGRVVCGLERKI